MNREQAAVLLSLAAARDQRTIGDADVLAWAEDLAGVDFDAARDVLSAHYRDTSNRITPSDVIRLVRAAKREQEAAGSGKTWIEERCAREWCACTHDECDGMFLNELEVHFPFGPENEPYRRVRWCPNCRPFGADTFRIENEEGPKRVRAAVPDAEVLEERKLW